MPIDANAALLKLNPLSPLTGLGGGDQLDMERQRLELMRQQFEETKQQNLRDEEYRRLSQQAATRREELALQKEREQAAAQAAAKNLEARQGALAELNKQYLEGNLEGMSLAANQLNQLGGYARRLDTGGPFPAWQADLEPPKTPPGLNPMDALGYGTLGTPDTLPETQAGAAEPLSTEEAFRQAGSVPAEAPAVPTGGDPTTDTPDALTSQNFAPGGEATDQYGPPTAAQSAPAAPPVPAAIQGLTPGGTNFTARRAPEAPDMTGGVTNDVPTDVINTAALQFQREQRLGPVMSAMAQAYPESYRGNIEKAGNAMLGAGLSPEKTMNLAQAARQEVGGAVEKQQAHEFKLEEEAAKAAAEEKDPIKVQRRMQYGANRAKVAYDEQKINNRVNILEAADDVEHVLSDTDHFDDQKAINLLMKLNAQVGAQSDADAMRMTGEGRASVVERIQNWIATAAEGGFSEPLRKSMIDYAHRLGERQREAVHDYVERISKSADSQKDPLVGQGYRQFLNDVMPSHILQEYDQEAGDAPEQQSSNEPSSGGGALEAMAAEHGFNAGAMRRVVGGESGGDPTAASKNSSAKGLWQALDSTAQRYVNPRTGEKFADSKELAQLSPEEQYQVLAEYLTDSGVTEKSPPEDYALAIAAPAFVGKGAHDDMVVYPKGSEKWEANKPWRPADGGDITVGSIIDYYFGNKKQAPKAGKGTDDAEALEGL